MKKFLFVIELTANLLLWIPGILLAVSPDMAQNSWQIFFAMFLGQLLWGISSYLTQKWTLLASSLFFALLNVWGIWARL